MAYLVLSLAGMIAGGVCVFLALEAKRVRLALQKRQQAAREQKIRDTVEGIKVRQQQATHALDARRQELDQLAARAKAEQTARQQELDHQIARLQMERADFDARVVSYGELSAENALLKRDLHNIDVTVRKLQLDRELQRQSQETLDQRSKELASRYLKDTVKWISASLTSNNFANSKQRLQDAIVRCRDIGYDVSREEEATLLADLKTLFEKAVRAAFEREEQARIKAQIREEQLREKEVERELQQLERERAAIRAALDKALAEAKDEHSAEVERLKVRLAEAEANHERAISQAQLTKSGHVYVISNIGSFGEGVFKIGLTRRLEPMDRVKELGDASVPFPFDVHMMVSADDAPALENALHRTLHKLRLNKIKPRKEFFKTDIEAIRRIVEEHHGEVQYVATPEALEYRQSLTISDEDSEFIESVYEKLPAEGAHDADDE